MRTIDAEQARAEFEAAKNTMADAWVVGCGGNEVPVLRGDGRWMLYVWNFALQQHGWLDLDTDTVEPA